MRALFFGSLLALATVICHPARAQERTIVREYIQPPANPEQLFLASLRERGLDRLAEEYCRRRLANAKRLPPESRAVYVLALSDILIARINQTADLKERDRLWKEATSLLESFLGTASDGPHVASVRYQLAAIELARAQESRLRWLVAPDQEVLRQDALTRVNNVRKLLEQVEADLDRTIRGLAREESPELYPVLENVRLAARTLLVKAWLEEAECYSTGSPERVRAARQALAAADRALPSVPRGDLPPHAVERTAELLLLRARAAILCGDYRVAESALHELTELQKKHESVPARFLDASLVERVRLAAGRHEWEKAYRLAKDAVGVIQTDQPELFLLLLESCLRLALRRGAVVSERFLQEAIEVAEKTGQAYGPYWRQRAGVLLADHLTSATAIRDPEILLAVGRILQARGDSQRAMEFFERAARLAGSRSDLRAQAQLAMGDALLGAGQIDRAARQLEELASTLGNTEEAAAALLKAVNCYATLYSRDRDPRWLDSYEKALRRLVEEHGSRKEAVQARWLLARLLEYRKQWAEAARLYREVVLADARDLSDQALLRAASAYRSAIQETWAKGERADQLLSEAGGFLEARARAAVARGNLAVARQLVTHLVELYADPNAGRYELAAKVADLLPAEEVYGPGPADRLRVGVLVALLHLGKVPEAERLARNITVSEPELALELLDRLNQMATASFHGAVRRAIGEIELSLIERLTTNSLSDSQKLRLAVARGTALALAGKEAEAREAFEQVASKLAGDPRALLSYARVLSDLGQWEAARDAWRRLAARLRPSDPAFFEARYELARACLNTGDPDQALRIIELTELLHPAMGGPTWKERFTELKAEAVFQRRP